MLSNFRHLVISSHPIRFLWEALIPIPQVSYFIHTFSPSSKTSAPLYPYCQPEPLTHIYCKSRFHQSGMNTESVHHQANQYIYLCVNPLASESSTFFSGKSVWLFFGALPHSHVSRLYFTYLFSFLNQASFSPRKEQEHVIIYSIFK